MAFSRVAALRSAARSARPSTFSRPQLWRQAARRGYASGGHAKSAGGDAVWAAGAVAVTVSASWYLLQNGPQGHHDSPHGETDNAHHGVKQRSKEEAEEAKEQEPEKEVKSEEESNKEKESESKDDTSEDKSEDKEEDDSKKKEDKKDEKSDDSTSIPEDGKDEHSVGETEQNEVKSVPDAKGGSKKRLESKASITQSEIDDSDSSEDKAAASKKSGDATTQSGKQEGLSNTDTKHSTEIAGNPEKSTKAEGGPETAKSKGTVDVNRPAK